MTKIKELIQQLCPEGVRYKRISEVAECLAGATPKTTISAYWDNGTIPWMSSGEVNNKIIYKTETKITQKGYDSCSTKMVPPNTVVIALAGQGKTRGTVAITRIALCTNQSLCSIITSSELVPEFLYHYLDGQYLKLRDISSGDGTRGGLHLKMIRDFLVPVPPLEVQQEIVRILDQFTQLTTELTTELTAELTARKKQYEYYRCKLLASYRNSRLFLISDLCKISRGRVISKDYIRDNGGKYPVYSSQTENDGVLGLINSYEYDGVYLTWTTDGANAGTIFYRKGQFNITNVCGLLEVNQQLVLPRYLYYSLGNVSENYVSKGMGNPKLMSNTMSRIKVYIPPLSEQHRIVSILDRFDALCNDLTSGLPAEIAARQKQYEYYRDKLLTFPERKEADA